MTIRVMTMDRITPARETEHHLNHLFASAQALVHQRGSWPQHPSPHGDAFTQVSAGFSSTCRGGTCVILFNGWLQGLPLVWVVLKVYKNCPIAETISLYLQFFFLKERLIWNSVTKAIISLLALKTQKDTTELHNSVTFPAALTTMDIKCKILFLNEVASSLLLFPTICHFLMGISQPRSKKERIMSWREAFLGKHPSPASLHLSFFAGISQPHLGLAPCQWGCRASASSLLPAPCFEMASSLILYAINV